MAEAAGAGAGAAAAEAVEEDAEARQEAEEQDQHGRSARSEASNEDLTGGQRMCVHAPGRSCLSKPTFGRAEEDTALSVARPASRVPLATRHAGKGPVWPRRSRVYDEPGVSPVYAAAVYHKEADSLPNCRFGTTSGRLDTYSTEIRGREPVGAFAIGARATVRSTTAAVHYRDLAWDHTSWMAHERSSDFRYTTSLARLVFPKSIGKWRLSSEVRTRTFKKSR